MLLSRRRCAVHQRGQSFGVPFHAYDPYGCPWVDRFVSDRVPVLSAVADHAGSVQRFYPCARPQPIASKPVDGGSRRARQIAVYISADTMSTMRVEGHGDRDGEDDKQQEPQYGSPSAT